MPAVNIEELTKAETAVNRRIERFRSSPFASYAATFATEFLVMLSLIVVYKMAANWLGQTGFSEYALARRVLAFLQPVTILGLGVGLPRCLALAEGRGGSDRGSRYLWATVLCVGGFTALLMAALMIGRDWFSYLLFGSRERQYLIPALALMLLGTSLHSILYAFFRGKMLMARANGLQLVNNGLVPLIVFAWFHQGPVSFLWHLGLAWTIISLLTFSVTPVIQGWKNPVNEAKELLHYGLQRVPGDFALIALLALPAIFIAHVGDIRQAGMVAFGLALVNMVAAVFKPIGIILLPKVSRALGTGDFRSVCREIVLIRQLALLLSTFFVILFELLGKPLIRTLLGHAYADAGNAVNILMIGALPLAFYSALRSVIDALHHRAINTINLLAALALFLLGSVLGTLFGSSQSVVWSFSGSLVVLAFLTHREVQKTLQLAEISSGACAPVREIGLSERLD